MKWMQVWHWENCGGFDHVVAQCYRLGLTGLLLKHDDGGRPFVDAESSIATDAHMFGTLVRDLKMAGLKVGLWGYHYGVNTSAEREMVARAMSFQPYVYVLDWEVEYENAYRFDSEGRQAVDVRALVGLRDSASPTTKLAHQPLAQPLYHVPRQYRTFNAFDLCLPQIYHDAMGFSPEMAVWQSYHELQEAGVTIPVVPWGQVYNVAGAEVTEWALACERMGAMGYGWWKFEDLNRDTATAVARLGGSMRRVNGIHQGWAALARRRCILEPKSYYIDVRKAFGLSEYDEWVTLDLRFAPVPNAERMPAVLIRDGDGSYAGYLGGVTWSKVVDVRMDASPEGKVWLEVTDGKVRPELVGILKAGR